MTLGKGARSDRAPQRARAGTPLRIQLVATMLALVALALVIVGVAGTRIMRGYLVQRVDDQLGATVRGDPDRGGREGAPGTAPTTAPTSANQEREGVPFGGPALTAGFFREELDVDGNGTGELRVPPGSAQSAPALPRLDLGHAEVVAGKPFTVAPQGQGSSWRVLVRAKRDGSGSLVVATSLSEVEQLVERLERVDMAVSAVVLVTLGVLSHLLVRSSLRQLVRVEHTAEAIAAGDLSQRVPETGTATEVGRLARALNAMLGQIERAFAAQQASEESARASEAQMRRFVADASHELRTPLTSIRGYAELPRRRPPDASVDPAEDRQLLERIEGQAQRMSVLVDDLLLLARLDQHRPLAREPVDLLALATEAVQDAQALAPDHGISLRYDQEDDDEAVHPVVLGDELRLRQVLDNLLSNARTHTPAGTAVTVGVATDAATATLTVADDGPGMDPATAERAFERFYRADPSRTRSSGGSGLGLSIVRGLVEAHGGTITLRTAPGAGATFTIVVPLARDRS